MPGSFRKVNYALRPAKAIERKMIAEAIRHLAPLIPTETLAYVGLGSPFFSDFTLFHRALGIENMTSIESEESRKPRFELNRPFGCVALEYGNAGDVMRRLDWAGPMILWLDYDYAVKKSMLEDIRYAARRLTPPSVLLVTADTRFGKEPDDRYDELVRRVGYNAVPDGTTLKDLDGWGSAAVSREIIFKKIEDTTSFSTAARKRPKRKRYRQLFNFRYQDGAPMMTCGGVILREEQETAFSKLGLSQMSFVRTGTRAFEIRVPSLTYRELHYFDSLLPTTDLRSIDRRSIPLQDLKAYSGVYRFFPAFVEAEL